MTDDIAKGALKPFGFCRNKVSVASSWFHYFVLMTSNRGDLQFDFQSVCQMIRLHFQS